MAEHVPPSPAGTTVLRRVPLAGGEVADAVERLELAGGESVLFKRTFPAEAAALRAVAAVPGAAEHAPALLDAGADERGAWIVTSFVADAETVDHAAVPEAIFAWLAGMHAHFLARPEALADMRSIDAPLWESMCLEHGLGGVRAARAGSSHPVLERCAAAFEAWAVDERMAYAPTLLPRTLVHGDVHGGNVLVGSGTAVLVDWANARLGPAMVDVANCAPEGSPQLAAYLRAYERATGAPPDPRQTEIGYHWATVFVHAQYLGWAAGALGPRVVGEMLDVAEGALARLGVALERA